MIDRTSFFRAIRQSLFGGRFTQGQVEGLNAILDEWEHRDELNDVRWLAYMLATAWHETAGTLQPTREFGGDRYLWRLYDIEGGRPSVANSLGNHKPGDGARFAGRGLVPLVGRKNYARMSALVSRPWFDVDLEKEPDAALRLDIAVNVLFDGMLDPCLNVSGGLEGYALDEFFNATRDDPVGARHIVSGLDQADLIAGYHRKFLAAIRTASREMAA